MEQYRLIDTDVLVVGGGMGGCQAAIRAKDLARKVVLAEKAYVSRSGATVFCHLNFAPTPPEQLRDWVHELARHATYLCDQEWAEIMLREEGDRIREMESWGAPFERDKEGNFRTERGRGQEVTACLVYDGLKMMDVVRAQTLRKGVEVMDRVMITDLLTSDGQAPTEGRVVGAVGFNTRTGQFLVFRAKAVVLATGMISPKLHLGHADNLTGDGQAMGYRCGAELVGMELTQGPMFCVWDRRFYTPGASQFQCFGAKIINAQGERIMEKYAPVGKEPWSDMAVIGQGIIKEILEGRGPVYFDMRGWSDEQVAKMRRALPPVMRAFDAAGVNVQERPVETTPIVGIWDGAGEGGLRIDFDCRTNIPGLYASGVAAQISGNISSVVGVEQTFANVSGYRAGENSAKTASRLEVPKLDERQIGRLQEQAFAPLRNKEGVSPDDIFKMAHQVVVPLENSMFKNEERINRVLSEVRRIAREEMPKISARDAHDLVKANEARNFVSLAELVYCAARERKESRLNHWREDYPYRDDVDWLKWVIVRAGNTGPQIRIEPLPLERYPFQPPERARIPAAVQFSFKGVAE